MKTNKILWAVRLIIIVAVALLALVWRPEALIFLVLLVFVGAILREAGVSRDADEREKMLHMKAGYYGFLSAMLIVFGILAWTLLIQNREAEPVWYFVLVVPLMVRGSFYTWQGAGLRRLGLGLGFTFGGIWTLFALISHGLTAEGFIESLIGLSILLPTALAFRWPRIGGGILVLLGIAGAVFFTPRWARFPNPFLVVLMFCLIPLPLIIAGIALIRSSTETHIES